MTNRSYRVFYADGSEDIVEGYDIKEARSEAESNYDKPIRRLTVILEEEKPPWDGCEAD